MPPARPRRFTRRQGLELPRRLPERVLAPQEVAEYPRGLRAAGPGQEQAAQRPAVPLEDGEDQEERAARVGILHGSPRERGLLMEAVDHAGRGTTSPLLVTARWALNPRAPRSCGSGAT